jgi:hypothetical protein
MGLWICGKIWASQAKESQAKLSGWEALRSIQSHVAEVNVNQSALGQMPG